MLPRPSTPSSPVGTSPQYWTWFRPSASQPQNRNPKRHGHLTTGTQKISENCRTIKTREQAFHMHDAVAQQVPSHHNIATPTCLFSVVENAQEPTKTFMSLRLSFTVNPSQPCSSSVLSHASLSMRKGSVVSSRQILVPDK